MVSNNLQTLNYNEKMKEVQINYKFNLENQ